MSPENFCYWLQGLLELQPDLKKLDADQVKMIRDHLGYVFTHVHGQAPARAPAPAVPDLSYDPLLRGLQGVVSRADPNVLSVC